MRKALQCALPLRESRLPFVWAGGGGSLPRLGLDHERRIQRDRTKGLLVAFAAPRQCGQEKVAHSILNYVPRRGLGLVRGRLASFLALLDQLSMTPHPFKRKRP